MFQVPPLNMQKLNFEKTQTELIELEKEIKAGIDFTDVSAVNANAERDLNVDFTIDNTLHMCKYPTNFPNMMTPAPDDVRMVRATVKLHAHIQLQQIQVQYYCAAPLCASNAIHSIREMNANQSERSETDFYMTDCCDIATIAVTAVVSFINRHSIPRVIERTQLLPLPMYYKIFAPQKDSTIKLTISVNQSIAPNLEQLFTPDFLIDSAHNATGFKSIYTGKIVTIVAAKNSNRYRWSLITLLSPHSFRTVLWMFFFRLLHYKLYRVQADHLPAITPVLESLIERVGKSTQPKIRLVNASPLPITALISLVDAHYKSYQSVQAIRVNAFFLTR